VARISDLLRDVPSTGPTASFEFFPPRTDDGERNLRDALNELEPLGPSFVSVTYGAGGSTRDRTHRIVVDLLEHTTMTPMAHLTSVSHTRAELRDLLERYRDAGVQNILALRGDPPKDEPEARHELAHAIELVELAREVGGDQFAIGVAAHPEGHPLSPTPEVDRRHLAAKLRAADFAITQFFFSARDYVRMMEELDTLGCDRPVVPGIMPVTNLGQIRRFAELSGAAFPDALAERFVAAADGAEVRRIGVELATQLCQELLDAGAPGLHFYTLNRSRATREIHANLALPIRAR